MVSLSLLQMERSGSSTRWGGRYGGEILLYLSLVGQRPEKQGFSWLVCAGNGGWFQTSFFVLIKLCVGNVLDHVMIFMCSAFWWRQCKSNFCTIVKVVHLVLQASQGYSFLLTELHTVHPPLPLWSPSVDGEPLHLYLWLLKCRYCACVGCLVCATDT